ncbi:uncharacterized protein VTP21DRAFT_2018 [Calcarisporiella thermophila]|uniref:uncharacterized protein n=1 Tax=Calcarisporiella thermophila TaxID=911321 RepID=UPI003741F4DF
MGIQGLHKVISDNAPDAIKSNEIKNYFGRKVAIDASMSIYQFLIAVRGQDGEVLQNEAGETTSHLMGMFYRTIRMCENGIKPAYVFDGKPPTLKSGELAKRLARRADATASMEAAKEEGDMEAYDKFSRRTVKVTREHNEECKKLLTLMGIPYVDAPCEAEAQCAALARAGKVFAAASEDMDTLTFCSPVLLRHLTFSEQRKMPIDEIHLDRALAGLGLTMEQFVDLCIILGCDYVDPIKGVGPKTALELIREHGCIEGALEHIRGKPKYTIPEDWPYEDARKLFLEPEVLDAADVELKWVAPDEEGIVAFLVQEKGFKEERVRKNVEKLRKYLKDAPQGRLDTFFKVVPTDKSKRKADGDEKSAKGKKAKTSTTAKRGAGRPRK